MPVNITTNGLIERTGTGAGGARTIGVGSGTSIPTRDDVASAYALQVGQVSGGEITAGTETALRTYAPADVKAFVDQHATPARYDLEQFPQYSLGIAPTVKEIYGINYWAFEDGDGVRWPFSLPEGFETDHPSFNMRVAFDTATSGTGTFEVSVLAYRAGGDPTAEVFDTSNDVNVTVPGTVDTAVDVSVDLTNRDSWQANDSVLIKIVYNPSTAPSGKCYVTSYWIEA